jgi:hypothetical protein
MGFGQFLRLWFRQAFKRSISLGDLWGSLAGNIISIFLQFRPEFQPMLKDLLWQIPIFSMAGAMAFRLMIAPYELWKEATAGNAQKSEFDVAYETERARIKAQDDAKKEARISYLNTPRVEEKQVGEGNTILAFIDPPKDVQRRLIADGRDWAHRFTVDELEVGFREYLESQRRFADLRRHLGADFLGQLNATRTSHSNADGAKYPYLVEKFLNDLDRLEKEWAL